MDQALWKYSGDRFHCKLELPADNIGQLAFVRNAGGDLRFVVETRLKAGHAPAIALASSPWRQAPDVPPLALEQNAKTLALQPDSTQQLLAALGQGFWFAIQLENLTVRVPTISWEQTAHEFEHCQTRLSPLSVEQARDRTLFYKQGQRALSTEQLSDLSRLAEYIKLDPKVSRILVDSYTDNTGSRLGNLQLSRERAADVAAALRDYGVPAGKIEQRAHGDRYPSATNATLEGRDLNRRITIRVIRQETGKSQ